MVFNSYWVIIRTTTLLCFGSRLQFWPAISSLVMSTRSTCCWYFDYRINIFPSLWKLKTGPLFQVKQGLAICWNNDNSFCKKTRADYQSEDWNIPKLRVRKTTCLFVICKLDRRETKTRNKSLVPCSWLLLVGDIFILLMENYTRLFFFHQFVSQARSSLRVS